MNNQLIWKKGLPTEIGWYWFRNVEHADFSDPLIYYVRKRGGELAISNSTLRGWNRMEQGEWAGPIPLPAEEGNCGKN